MRCSVRSLVVTSLVATLVAPSPVATLVAPSPVATLVAPSPVATLVAPSPVAAPSVLGVGPRTAAEPVTDAALGNPRRASGSSEDAPWVWPTESDVVVRPWKAPESDYGPGHRGLDVAAEPGTRAVAVASGTVTFAGPVGGRPVIAIDHGDGLVSTLDAVDASVAPGDRVERGAPVGTTTAGHCTPSEPCLHIGARLDGRYVDPAVFLPRAAWPVLLPDGTGRALHDGQQDARRRDPGVTRRTRRGRQADGRHRRAAHGCQADTTVRRKRQSGGHGSQARGWAVR